MEGPEGTARRVSVEAISAVQRLRGPLRAETNGSRASAPGQRTLSTSFGPTGGLSTTVPTAVRREPPRPASQCAGSPRHRIERGLLAAEAREAQSAADQLRVDDHVRVRDAPRDLAVGPDRERLELRLDEDVRQTRGCEDTRPAACCARWLQRSSPVRASKAYVAEPVGDDQQTRARPRRRPAGSSKIGDASRAVQAPAGRLDVDLGPAERVRLRRDERRRSRSGRRRPRTARRRRPPGRCRPTGSDARMAPGNWTTAWRGSGRGRLVGSVTFVGSPRVVRRGSGAGVLRRRATRREARARRPRPEPRRRGSASVIGITTAFASVRSVAGGTGNTAVAVPAAAQTTWKRPRSGSMITRSGRTWPIGGMPPIVKPVSSFASRAVARRMSGCAGHRGQTRKVDAVGARDEAQDGLEAAAIGRRDEHERLDDLPELGADRSAQRLPRCASTRRRRGCRA